MHDMAYIAQNTSSRSIKESYIISVTTIIALFAILASVLVGLMSFTPTPAYAGTPALSTTTVIINKQDYQAQTVELRGCGPYDDVQVTGGDNKIASINYYDGLFYLYGKKVGTTTYTITVTPIAEDWSEGTPTTLQLTVIVLDLKTSSSKLIGVGITLYKGESTKLSLSGNTTRYTTSYTSSDTSIATVSSAGRIKARGYGLATITASIGALKVPVSVNVGTKKAVKAVRWAVKKTPATYSQESRMSKGKFDCSSLTGRAYGTQRMYLSGDKSWASTAAMQAHWCVRKKHVVCNKTIDYELLRPGDLIFYRYDYSGVNPGYKHIDHVAMYAGNGQTIEVRDGLRYVGGWASPAIMMVGRPTQTSYAVTAATNIKAKRTSNTAATISWKKKKGVTGYCLYRSVNDYSNFTKLATVNASTTSFTDTKLAADTQYCYKVRCYKKIKGKTYYGPAAVINVS